MSKHTAVSVQRRRLLALAGAFAIGQLYPFGRVFAGTAPMGDMPMGDMPMNGHDHMHHHAAMANNVVKRSEATYHIPETKLVRRDGTEVAFPEALDTGRPVLLNFIYTSCTAICPLTSQVFSTVQDKLRQAGDSATMVSISIDPEYDTPTRLTSYAKKFHAGDSWQYYTGTLAESVAMQKAFDVFRGDKMDHSPVTFLRAAPGQPWVRLDGFASPDELLEEYHHLVHG